MILINSDAYSKTPEETATLQAYAENSGYTLAQETPCRVYVKED